MERNIYLYSNRLCLHRYICKYHKEQASKYNLPVNQLKVLSDIKSKIVLVTSTALVAVSLLYI